MYDPFPCRILSFTVSCHWRLFQQQTNHTWPSLWNQRRATFVGKNSPWPLTLSERKTASIWVLHNLSAYLNHQCSLSLLSSPSIPFLATMRHHHRLHVSRPLISICAKTARLSTGNIFRGYPGLNNMFHIIIDCGIVLVYCNGSLLRSLSSTYLSSCCPLLAQRLHN